MTTPTLWYYHKEGRGFGPVEEADIRGLLARSEIAADTLVWRDGLSNWTEAQNTELSGFLSDVPPLPLPVPIVPSSRRKPSKLFWLLFTLSEIFNLLIFGIPLFAALVLSISGAIDTAVTPSTATNVQQQKPQPQTIKIPD